MQVHSVAQGRDSGGKTGDVAPSPIDHQHLRRFTYGIEGLELEVLGLFAGQAPETLAALRSADSAKAWRDAAHTLKGSARAVGAWRVADGAAAAEVIGDGHASPIRGAVIEALEAALDEARAYISRL